MTSSRSRVFTAFVALGITLPIIVGACDRAPTPAGLKEWTATDHDGEKKGGGAPNAKQGAKGSGGGAADLADVTWRAQCSSCHGPGGHGDGPQGPMFKASDLTQADWQAKTTDEEIAAAIRNGKGRMPKFDLPDEVVKGLVSRIRSLRGK